MAPVHDITASRAKRYAGRKVRRLSLMSPSRPRSASRSVQRTRQIRFAMQCACLLNNGLPKRSDTRLVCPVTDRLRHLLRGICSTRTM
jgi:hypothetical protein